MESLIGKVIGNYRIVEKIGQGGMGTVFKAMDTALDRVVALKMIDPILAREESFLRRFKNEAKALALLIHPNIVIVHAFLESEFGFFIVMEYVDGKNLADILLETGPLPWNKAMPIFKQILSAIGYAHSHNVIHRDLKPRNIMLTADGVTKVTDFGLAKVKRPHGTDSTITKSGAGTLYYMSPEQVKGLGGIDHRTDIYALGMTFYEILAGRTPFDKSDTDFTIYKAIVEKKLPPPSHFKSDLPNDLTRIIMKSIEKQPDDRFQSAEEVLASIGEFEEKMKPKPASEPMGFLEKAKKLIRAKPWLIRLAGAMLGAIALILVIVLFVKSRPDEATPENIPNNSTVKIDSTAQNGTYDTVDTVVPVVPVSSGGIAITTDPDNARVSLNSNYYGTTPCKIEDLAPGSYKIKINKEWYKEISFTVEVTGDQTEIISKTLDPVGALVFSIEPSDALIYVDGRRVTSSPVRDLTVGRHQIVARKSGYTDFSRSFAIEHRVTTPLDIRMVLASVEFSILVKPFGSIYIDNVLHQEETNFRYSTPLASGRHRIKITHPNLGVWEEDVIIGANSASSMVVDFTKKGKITIVATPGWGYIYVDGKNTEKVTPMELELGVGIRSIQIKRIVTDPNGQTIRLASENKKILIKEGDNGKISFTLNREN